MQISGKAVTVFCCVAAAIQIAYSYFEQQNRSPEQSVERTESAKEFATAPSTDQLKSGDIIFQTSMSPQSTAIELATHSELSHCGILFQTGNSYSVLEAGATVRQTSLETWIKHGRDGRCIVKRVAGLSDEKSKELIKELMNLNIRFLGKKYDAKFSWTDDEMYCSELVWKMYHLAGVDLGKLQLLEDFDLSSEPVKKILAERYGQQIPMKDTVISPVSIFNSDKLFTVYTR